MCANVGASLLIVYETYLQRNTFYTVYTPLFTFPRVGDLNVMWELYLDTLLSGLMIDIITLYPRWDMFALYDTRYLSLFTSFYVDLGDVR